MRKSIPFSTSIVLSVLILSFPSCSTYLKDAQTAFENENYDAAKQCLEREIERKKDRGDFWPDKLVRDIYFLAAVHAKLKQYDSMKACLDECLNYDANFKKKRREFLLSYSIYEFNQGVNYYNAFFFRRSIEGFKRALQIVKGEDVEPEYEAVIHRCLLFAYAGDGDFDAALSHCKKAASLGDGLAKRALEMYEKEKKVDKPDKLEPRERTEPRII